MIQEGGFLECFGSLYWLPVNTKGQFRKLLIKINLIRVLQIRSGNRVCVYLQEQFGVMGDSATAMRDPVFYRWHSYVDDIFVLHKKKLTPYSAGQVLYFTKQWTPVHVYQSVWGHYFPCLQLDFPGIRVSSVGVEGPAGANQFGTQWEQSTVELSRGLDFTPRGSVLARFTHLQHDEFDYVLVYISCIQLIIVYCIAILEQQLHCRAGKVMYALLVW